MIVYDEFQLTVTYNLCARGGQITNIKSNNSLLYGKTLWIIGHWYGSHLSVNHIHYKRIETYWIDEQRYTRAVPGIVREQLSGVRDFSELLGQSVFREKLNPWGTDGNLPLPRKLDAAGQDDADRQPPSDKIWYDP